MYRHEQDPQNMAECWLLHSFRPIIGTDIYLLLKHNLHIKFVLCNERCKKFRNCCVKKL